MAVGGSGDNGNIGATWVFTRTGSVWNQQTKLIGTSNIGNSLQGNSVSLSSDGNTMAIGGPGDDDNIGASWIFTRTDNVWGQQSKLIGTEYIGSSQQGISVSLSSDGNILVIGGSGDNNNVGAIWVFTRTTNVWTQPGSKIQGTRGVYNVGTMSQGISVAISLDGDTIVFGGIAYNNNVGAFWVYIN